MDDSEFLDELAKDKHQVAPIGGELSFSFILQPVTVQGKQAARSAFRNTIQEELQHFQYLLSGDVSLEITLQVHQSDRYESDASPDLDNFLKPLLDSLTGPNGILIDDCQIRSLGINWISWGRHDTKIELQLRFADDEYVAKRGLLFVQIDRSPLCMPIDTTLPKSQQRILLLLMRHQFRTRDKLKGKGWDYYSSSEVPPFTVPIPM
jgi:Holliday junction resolvase RusA-like endonuclease